MPPEMHPEFIAFGKDICYTVLAVWIVLFVLACYSIYLGKVHI